MDVTPSTQQCYPIPLQNFAAFVRNNSTTQHDQIYKRLLSEPITASTNHKAHKKTVFEWRKWTDPLPPDSLRHLVGWGNMMLPNQVPYHAFYVIICANFSVVLYIVVIVSSFYFGYTWLPILYRVGSPARWIVHDLFQRRWCELDWYISWWRHQMEAVSAVLALCEWKPPTTGGFPSQMQVTRSFYVFFDQRLDKQLSKQSTRRWFETPLRSLWRQCNDV